MKCTLLTLALIGFVFSFSWQLWAQCGTPRQLPSAFEFGTRFNGPYEWRSVDNYPDQIALFKHGARLGTYVTSTGFYHPWNNGTKTAACVSPVPPPFLRTPEGSNHTVFGVDGTQRIHRERYWDGEREISRADLAELLGADLPDDSKNAHLTVITKDAAGAKTAAAAWDAFAKAKPTASKVRFQAYDASQPVNKAMLAPNRLDIDAAFQRAGVVLLAQAAGDAKDGRSKPASWYQMPTLELYEEALRNVNPDWQPNLPKVPLPFKMPDLSEAWWLVGAGVVLGLLTLIGATIK